MSIEDIERPLEGEKTDTLMTRRHFGDLGFILIGGVTLGCLILTNELFTGDSNSKLRTIFIVTQAILGLMYVLYIPGYLLQALFFSQRDDLNGIERLGLSLGLSVAMVTLLALLLNATRWGLHPEPIMIGQAGMIILLMVCTTGLRILLPADQVYQPDVVPHLHNWWLSLQSGEKRMMMMTGGILAITFLVAAWIFLTPARTKNLTEFYILGKEGLAEDYPREISAGEMVTVTTGITNREGVESTYNIELKQGNQVIGEAGPIMLENEATWEQPVEFSVPAAGDDQEVEFYLEREGQTSPYRTLRLFINVVAGEAP